jgi:hypothetical protein
VLVDHLVDNPSAVGCRRDQAVVDAGRLRRGLQAPVVELAGTGAHRHPQPGGVERPHDLPADAVAAVGHERHRAVIHLRSLS